MFVAGDKRKGYPVVSAGWIAGILFSCFLVGNAGAHPHILKTTDRTETSFQGLIEDLENNRFVFIGELHDHVGHHAVQLNIISALRRRGVNLAVGLEMVRKSDQDALDAWVSGAMSEEEFLKVFRRHWQLWEPYRSIFLFARKERVRLIGLNISQEIVTKIGRNGFGSLSPGEREALGGITCRLSPAYERFVRRAMGEHAPRGQAFRHFCEAQLVWDKAMARNLIDFAEDETEMTVVVLAGGGHAWKHGILAQMSEKYQQESRVLLPEGSSAVNRLSVTPDDADYYWLDFGKEGWNVPEF